MRPSEIGVYLGLIFGFAAGLGYVGGGIFADYLGKINHRYALWGVSLTTLFAWLFLFPVYLSENSTITIFLFIIPAIFSNFYLATTFAQTQSLVGLRMRGVASALVLFIINIIGLGMGPQITGILSDLLSSDYGMESMRYSLLIVGAIASPWTAFHFFLAGKSIEKDLAKAIEY